MKFNKIMWVLVVMCFSATIAVIFDVADVRSQEKSSISPKATPSNSSPDFSKYGVAEYDAVVSLDASALERRKQINERYDNQDWVMKNPHPETGKVGRYTESTPLPAIPIQESDLIVTGTVVGVETYLSNDKSGIYSQFTVRVVESLKNSLQKMFDRDALVNVDRAGGVVRYPHGQSVLYLDSDKGLPEVGRQYAFFLKGDGKSDSLEIVTLYELQETSTIPMDSGRSVDDLRRLGKSGFIEAVREKLSKPRRHDE